MNLFYANESAKVYHGDSKSLSFEGIGLSVFSPPYFMGKAIDYDVCEDGVDVTEYYDQYLLNMRDVFKTVFNSLLSGGRMCVNIDDKFASPKYYGENYCRPSHANFIRICGELGFSYRGSIIWIKQRQSHASGGSNMVLGSYPYPSDIPLITNYEYILLFRKSGKREVEKENKEKSRLTMTEFKWLATGVWNIQGEGSQDHPAVFPYSIPSRLIKLFSFYGDTVLDPFCGSGTTGRAAVDAGRKFIGVDCSSKYCELTERRLRQLNLYE